MKNYRDNSKDYYLIKNGTTKKVLFQATENAYGMLVNPKGHGMLIGEDITAAGFTPADAQVPIQELTPALQELVLRVGDNRGHKVEEKENRKVAAQKERRKQNAFLKANGYRWEKRGYYASEPGEKWEGWCLVTDDAPRQANVDGTEVIGWHAVGEEAVQTGIPLHELLIELGYHGEDAKQALIAQRERSAARQDALEKVEDFFENATAVEAPTSAPDFKEAKVLSANYKSKYLLTSPDQVWVWKWDLWEREYFPAYLYDIPREVAEAIRLLQETL